MCIGNITIIIKDEVNVVRGRGLGCVNSTTNEYLLHTGT